MGWNGSGTFTLTYSWVNDAANAIPITASRMDTQEQDMAGNGFGNCVTRDGQGKLATDFLPATDAAYNLGSIGSRWINGFFSGAIGIGMSPVNSIDITKTQDGASIVSLLNGSAGTSANSRYRLNNGTSLADVTLFGTGYTTSGIFRQDGMSVACAGAGGLTLATTVAQPIYFAVNSIQIGQFDANGLLVGSTTTGGWAGNSKFEAKSAANAVSGYATGATGNALLARVDNTATNLVGLDYNGSQVGAITTNGSVVVYGGTSDERLKENIQDAGSAGAILDALKVRSWDWKTGAKSHEQFGFVAQEEFQVAPFAVVEGDSGPEVERLWMRDDSRLVPLLVKEIQELRARVAALEAK